jgi:di/tricarboxylate transporter
MESLSSLAWQGWFTLSVVALTFGLFAFTRYAPDIITTAALSLLLLTGIVSPQDGLAGFANEGMLTVAVMYVVVTGLTETGAVAWISQALLGRPRSAVSARLRLMAPVAVLSAFINNTPVVAVFLPAVQDWARRHRLELSRLMIPLSFAGIAGGTCTLIGTSTNLVVNGMYTAQSGGPGLHFFELAWIGIPVVAVVFVFLLTSGHWLLPKRRSAADSNEDVRQYTAEMLVPDESPLIGKSIEAAGLRQLPGLFLIEIDRAGQCIPAVASSEVLHGGDRLVFAGIIESVLDLQRTRGLLPATDQVFKLDGPRAGRCFVEAVLSDTSPTIGMTVRGGRFRNRYNAVIIAVNRNGVRLPGKIGEIELRAGDTLLLEARPSFVEQQRNSRDFLLVSQLGDSHPLNHERALTALLIVLAMIASVTSGLLSMLQGALLAAGLMLLTRCTDGATARKAPDWQVLVVIATSFGIGAALQNSGAASFVANGLISMVGHDPQLALAGVFLTASLLTSFATNNVAAVLVFPICLQLATAVDSNPEPFLITLMVAASASFATPIGYQTNLMVFNLGGYRFSDFLRVGVPLTLLVGLVTVLLVPLIWPF